MDARSSLVAGEPTVPWRCVVCDAPILDLRDPMMPPVPLGRLRTCRKCKRVVCRQHGKRVGRDAYECTECRAKR